LHKFAFIIHPLNITDVARKWGFAKLLPVPVVEALLHRVSSKVVSHITGIRSATGEETEGWFIGLPLTAKQLKSDDPARCIAKIVDAGKMGQDLGAEIVGLGAFTSIVGDAGFSIANGLDIGVTTGNSYTVATAVEGALKATEMLGRKPEDCVAAVLGATGSIGKVVAKLLAPRVAKLVLNARQREPLEELAAGVVETAKDVAVETDLTAALKDADIVVAVTSAVDAVVQPAMLKRGAVVCDVARPRDVSVSVAKERDDVLVIEGGAVAIPGDVDFGFDFGFPPGEAYACMAETMILALEGRVADYSLGREIQIEQVEEISSLAVKHGFKLAGFRSFEKRVSESDISRVKAKLAASRLR
jgi:predicted amino acid dehydrogenase